MDGLFGPRTREAVIDFQRDRGLAADGIAGPKTQAALDQVCTTPPIRKRVPFSLIFTLGFHGNDHIDWGESASVGQGEIRTFVALDGSGN